MKQKPLILLLMLLALVKLTVSLEKKTGPSLAALAGSEILSHIPNFPSESEAGLVLNKCENQAQKQELEAFFRKERVTIAVMDSGLGGLAVMAEAVKRMKDAGIFKATNFVFYNALFSAEGGYNSLKTREEKIQIFSSALDSLEKSFHPDLILIGCNTLSVLYDDTPFAQKAKIPVVGIIDAGAEMIAAQLRENLGSVVIIFGTPTTISEGAYQKKLADEGFSASRIFAQACPELESFIERDHAGDETGMLISGFVDEALQNLPSPLPPFSVSLNCTHYGYSLPLWEKAFHDAGVKPLAILNPNSRMINFLFAKEHLNRFPKTETSARVVSMVEISRQQIDSLGEWLEALSPETAAALRRYEYNPSLFGWKSFIK